MRPMPRFIVSNPSRSPFLEAPARPAPSSKPPPRRVSPSFREALVIDFAKYNRQISDLDLDRRTVRVGPGVILDQLNQFLRPHGFCFGPDVATSSRATLGGMIANDSSGAHTPVYGTT